MITENKEHSQDKADSDALPKEHVARKQDTAAHGGNVMPWAGGPHRKHAHEKPQDRMEGFPAAS